MDQSIIETIRRLDFEQAEKIWKESNNKKDTKDAIVFWDFETESIIPYTFAHHIITKNQNNALWLMNGHDLAIELLLNSIPHIEDAYFSASYHVKEMIQQTNRQDTDYLEYLLLLNKVPDEVISDEEAEKACRDILVLDPNNEIAKDWLKDKKNK